MVSEKNIRLENVVKTKSNYSNSKLKRNSKGFVLRCLQKKASQKIIEAIMRTMQYNNQEYICVRKRTRPKDDDDKFVYKDTFPHNAHAYVVIKKDFDSTAKRAQKLAVKSSIRYSLEQKVLTPEIIQKLLKLFQEDMRRSSRTKKSVGNIFFVSHQ